MSLYRELTVTEFVGIGFGGLGSILGSLALIGATRDPSLTTHDVVGNPNIWPDTRFENAESFLFISVALLVFMYLKKKWRNATHTA